MATRTQCPNCGNRTIDVSIYRCANCGFTGCLKAGFLSSSGCWKQSECPRCGSKRRPERIAYIGGIDSN